MQNHTSERIANVVKCGGAYHLFMFVEGQWLDTGITAPRLLEICQIADQGGFVKVLINAPMTPANQTAQAA